jgi:hypothetical protein
MLALTRPGGFVALGHETDEAVREGYVGCHQWNFERDGAGRFVIWHPRGVVDVTARLASLAAVEVVLEQEGGWADVIITRRPETAGMAPEALAAAAGLDGGFDRALLSVVRLGEPEGDAARAAVAECAEDPAAVAVHFAAGEEELRALAPALTAEALLVAVLEPGDRLPAGFGARTAAVGELALDRGASARPCRSAAASSARTRSPPAPPPRPASRRRSRAARPRRARAPSSSSASTAPAPR